MGGDFLDGTLGRWRARRELGLTEGGQYIGTVSSLVAYEGLDDLIEAFVLLAPRLPDLKLLIVGDGVSRPALEVQARQSGYADRIIFTGRVPREQAVRYHQALDVFVVPRKDLEVTRSVTPLKPVEALACARPVVASRLPALAEIVEDGVTGRLATADDPVALSEAIGELLSDPRARGANGRRGQVQGIAGKNMGCQRGGLGSRAGKAGSDHLMSIKEQAEAPTVSVPVNLARLSKVGQRPDLLDYLVQLWDRRSFIYFDARARVAKRPRQDQPRRRLAGTDAVAERPDVST